MSSTGAANEPGELEEKLPPLSNNAGEEEDKQEEEEPIKMATENPSEYDNEGTTDGRSEDEEMEEAEKEDDRVDEEEPEDIMEGTKEETASTMEETNVEQAVDAEEKETAKENDFQEDSKSDAAYSTRGRSADHTSTDLLDSLARESDLALAREREHPPAAIGASFLSESLTEEERRTRTRYLPDVEGFHALRKHEVKSDLALARTVISASGSAATINKKKRSRDDGMEVDGDDISPSEDDRSSDALRANAKVIEMGRNEYVLPPTAFVAPPSTSNSSNGDSNGRSGKGVPTEIEAVTAFNPPRPPESVGPKKKHRMMRWEQNPTSIEIDLANYRKTVQKTRHELKNAQNERDRIIAVDNHMRRNFFAHLQALNDELAQLSQELATVQQECVSSADLLTSRTRSRGAGKGSYVMRDVLTVLRTRGAEMEEKGVNFDNVELPPIESNSGVGGVGVLSFKDWDKNTKITPKAPASGWIVPGDLVSTPYGDGKVKEVLPPSNAKDSTQGNSNKKAPSLFPRVSVELSFGLGYFTVDAVQSKENPSTYSDARLAQRWRGIIDSAPAFGPFLDMEGMQNFLPWDETEADGDAMDVEDDGKSDAADEKKKRPRVLPFASDIIPTNVGRGALLHKTDLVTLDKKLHQGLYESVGVLGDRENRGVPKTVSELESRKERFIRAKAKSLQLTNALLRQRRITKMNEKTLAASQERSERVEALVTEMRSDLGSLKRRLDEEVLALGINEEEARKILADHYGQSE